MKKLKKLCPMLGLALLNQENWQKKRHISIQSSKERKKDAYGEWICNAGIYAKAEKVGKIHIKESPKECREKIVSGYKTK